MGRTQQTHKRHLGVAALTMKAVIFDMDGVLIDSHPVHKRAWRRFLASVDRNVTEEQLDFVLDGRKREDILRHFLGELTPEQVAAYGRRKEAMFREEASDVVAIAGVEAFIDQLQSVGIPIALASSGSTARVEFILARLQLRNRFSSIVTGDDVHHGKPDPTIFKKAADRINAPYHSSLVVEDAVSGVVAAKSAGMKCLAIASNGRRAALNEAGVDLIASDFQQICFKSLEELFS